MRPRQLILIGVLAFCALLLIILNTKGTLAPLKSFGVQAPRPLLYVFNGAGRGISDFFSYFGSARKLNRRNADLANEVLRLKQENIALEQYRAENQILKKELDYRQTAGLQLVSGTVISSDPTGFSQTLLLNIGTDVGIKKGSATLVQGVFVGTIIETNSFTSRVLLVSDPQSAVQAQIAGSGDSGIVRGSGGSGIVLDMLAQNTAVKKNDPVITFGAGNSIPSGLLIGTVGEIQSLKNDLLQKASVISGVDLKKIKFVSVVQQ